VPLREGKIRYPLRHEMEKCYPKFENELKVLNPSIVFLLGKQVASFIIKKHLNQNVTLDSNFNYQFHLINNIKFVPIHHPSYILVYKRKFINQYIQGLRKICKEAEIPFEQELIC
jgi:DNA polymerase